MDNKRFKVVFIGCARSGKTSFISYVRTGKYNTKYSSTIGVEVNQIYMDDITISCWDVAGNEKQRGLGNGYYMNADLCVVFYTGNPKEDAISRKYEIEFIQSNPDCGAILRVASKRDKCTIECAVNPCGLSSFENGFIPLSLHDPKSATNLLNNIYNKLYSLVVYINVTPELESEFNLATLTHQ